MKDRKMTLSEFADKLNKSKNSKILKEAFDKIPLFCMGDPKAKWECMFSIEEELGKEFGFSIGRFDRIEEGLI